MPTYWESSERPLFVKTVVVNGSRHAILSQVDPLRQSKRSEGAYGSHSAIQEIRDDLPFRRVKTCYPSKRDISSELQNCLVKLRVVLGTQDQKKKIKKDKPNDEDKSDIGVREQDWKPVKKLDGKAGNADRSEMREDYVKGFRKGNSYKSMIQTKDDSDGYYTEIIRNASDNGVFQPPEAEFPQVAPKNNNFQTARMEPFEEILKNYSSYFFPLVFIKTRGLAWNCVAAESNPARNFNNPLSDRVLQWLELARRRKESQGKLPNPPQATEQMELTNSENLKKLIEKIHNRKYNHKCENGRKTRRGDGDVEEEVKQESDIETVLSVTTPFEHPRNSGERAKEPKSPGGTKENPRKSASELWINSFLSIPDKLNSDFSITEQLQQSIINSFETIAHLERTIESGRLGKKSNRKSPSKSRKGLLMKQTKIRISSDEDENGLYNKIKNSKRPGNGKKTWDHKRRFKHRRQKSMDENEEPSDESGRVVRILYNEIPLSEKDSLMERGGKRVWPGKGMNKPQLHIFMPGIDPKYLESHEESASDDGESYST